MSKFIKSNNYHVVNNFPKDFSFFSKALSNIAFFILTTKTTNRQNLLTKEDQFSAKKVIQKGDIILAGDFSRISRFFTGKFFTHTLLYIGENNCIHATIDGVGTISFDKLFSEYDTLLIIRPNIKDNIEKTIENAVSFATQKIGLAYNFYFEHRYDRYICTQLINKSYRQSGFNLSVGPKRKREKGRFRIFSRIHRVIKADDFLKGDFKIIYTSKEIRKPNYFKGKKKGLAQSVLRSSLQTTQ